MNNRTDNHLTAPVPGYDLTGKETKKKKNSFFSHHTIKAFMIMLGSVTVGNIWATANTPMEWVVGFALLLITSAALSQEITEAYMWRTHMREIKKIRDHAITAQKQAVQLLVNMEEEYEKFTEVKKNG